MNDTDRIGQALKLYSDELKSYAIGKLKDHYGAGKAWLEAYLASFRSEGRRQNVIETLKNQSAPEDVFDIVHVKDLLLANQDVFKEDFKRSLQKAATWADEIVEVRHKYAHQQDIPTHDVTRTLDSMSRILGSIGAVDAAKTVAALRDNVMPKGALADGLPAWWRVAEPHDDIKRGGFDEGTFAAKLDDVVAGRAPREYQHAEEFFKKTYLTKELHGLLVDTLKRLAGKGGEAVVQLRTPFGGGKTHTLIALYHLVKSAADIEEMGDIQAVLREAGLAHVPHARTAVIVGTTAEVQPYSPESGVTVHTLWGEIAYQLGGKDGYAVMKASDEARVSPSKDTLHKLFAKYGKVLILLDELLVYQVRASAIRVEGSNLQAQTFAFMQTLTEVVGSSEGAALVTTFPESHVEYYDHAQAQAVFDTLTKILGRVEATRVPVQGEEIFEVVRRRLFQNVPEAKAKQAVAAYMDLYHQLRDDLPSDVRSGDYAKRMLRAYPFHPELITVLYERWGTLQAFQKTRGVLRLLARVVEVGWMSAGARPLISLGDVGLEDSQLRASVAQILRDGNWDPVIASDIVPEDGKAFQIDRERGGEYAKHRLCQTTATAIFMYSHSGGAERGVTDSRLRLALVQPDGITPNLLVDAVSRMKGRLYYLYGNGGWSFRVQPNLNSVLTDRMAQVKVEAIEERLKEAVQARVGSGLLRPFVWSHDHKDVPDSTQLKLVLLSPKESTDDAEALERLRRMVQNNHASGPRINKNTLLYVAGHGSDFARARGLVRELLALEEVGGDRGLGLSAEQRQDLQGRLGKAREGLPEAAKACYSVLYEPLDAAASEYRVYDIAAQVKTARSVMDAVVETLRSEDRLLPALDPALLISGPYGLWPDEDAFLKLGNLRDYFHRFPHLPYLESEEVLKQAAVRGVQNGIFEAALQQGDEVAKIWRRTNPPAPQDLFFANHYVLARVGVIPREGESVRANGGDSAPAQPDRAGSSAGAVPNASTTLPKTDPKKTTGVRLRFGDLQIAQLPALVDVASALEDAKGKVGIEVVITASNPTGLDETLLDLSVRELLMQHGLAAEWEEP